MTRRVSCVDVKEKCAVRQDVVRAHNRETAEDQLGAVLNRTR